MSIPILIAGSIALAVGLMYAFVLLVRVGVQDKNGGPLTQEEPTQRTTSPYPRSYATDRQHLRQVHKGAVQGTLMMGRFQSLIGELADQNDSEGILTPLPADQGWLNTKRRRRDRNRAWVEASIDRIENRFGIADTTSSFNQKGRR